jgi:hypothetical protein
MSGLKRDFSELTTNWRLLLAALVGSAVGFLTLPLNEGAKVVVNYVSNKAAATRAISAHVYPSC